MFGLFKKKKNATPTPEAAPASAPAAPAQEIVIEVAPGLDFSDLTSDELCDAALADGRIERFQLISERFGGEAAGPNLLLGPVGTTAAKDRIDEDIIAAIQAGHEVNFQASLDYGDSPSRVPQAVRLDLGSLGVRVLKLWG